jgi:hypothetical protein
MGQELVARSGWFDVKALTPFPATHKEFANRKVKSNCRFLHFLHFVAVGRNDNAFGFRRNAGRVKPSTTNLAYSLRVLTKDADILDAFHAGLSRLGDGLVVDHVLLEPEVRDAETNHIFNDGRNVHRGTEDVHEVDAFGVIFLGSGVRQLKVGIALEAVHLLEGGIHGKDVVALHDEIAGDVVAGPPGLVAYANNGDSLRTTEHFVDECGIVHVLAASS